MGAYYPQQGDIIFLNFDPQSGHEQKGRRPALIVSNSEFHFRTNLALVCPITSKDNGFPLHISLKENQKITGFVMCEHMKCLDIQSRNPELVDAISQMVLDEVIDVIHGFIE